MATVVLNRLLLSIREAEDAQEKGLLDSRLELSRPTSRSQSRTLFYDVNGRTTPQSLLAVDVNQHRDTFYDYMGS